MYSSSIVCVLSIHLRYKGVVLYMNKQIFLSLALGALVGFSMVRAVSLPEGYELDQAEGSESHMRSAWNSLKTMCDNHKTEMGGVAGAVIFTYALHKIMYIKCPWYRNWVDGVDEDSEANKLPWART